MSEVLTIALSKLSPWSGNVRKTGITEDLASLAASIEAHGLLQSLTIRPARRGKYHVIAGQRRYLALCALAERGTIAKDHPVPCLLATDTVDPTEISLAENVVRAPMHPADQFDAFAALIEAGATTTDVAARFGLSELAVTQRLRLGKLSPVVLTAYREGDIDLACAQAFTISDDHEAQERILTQLNSWNCNPRTIRRALAVDEIEASDRRVRFVGLSAYEAAGGAVRRDLFSDDHSGYIQNADLLDRLVAEKLAAAAAEVSAEGWLWVESATDLDYQMLSQFSRQHAELVDLPEDEQAELDRLTEEYDTLTEADDDASDQLESIERQIDELNHRAQSWTRDTLSIAGAIVSLGHDGKLRIERGLVRKADQRKLDATQPDDDTPAVVAPKGLSPRLIEDLTAQKSAAISAELAQRPDIALTAVVHALLLDLHYPAHATATSLRIRITPPALASSIAKPDISAAHRTLVTERESMGDHLPGKADDLWSWCLHQSQERLLTLLAYATSFAIDTVHRKHERSTLPRLAHGQQLAEALSLDMARWYQPTAESYFSRISRQLILTAIDEATGSHAPSVEKLKKAELAARAEKLVAATGWLPEPLRPCTGDDAASSDRDDEQGPE